MSYSKVCPVADCFILPPVPAQQRLIEKQCGVAVGVNSLDPTMA